MAQIYPTQTTYSDTTLVKRTITDVVSVISPRDTPLIANLGGLDGAAAKFNFVNGTGKAVEWSEDTLYAMSDSLGASITSNATTMTVADAYVFNVGDIGMVDSEYFWVSAIASSTTLTVTRGLGDTTEASHANAAVVYLVGNARLEGAEVSFRGVTDKTTNYNYSQIFQEGIKVARSARTSMPQYGIADEFMYQSEKLIPSMLRQVEKMMFYGDRQAGSASAPRQSGGLPEFITDNTVNYTTSFTQANIEDGLEEAYKDGGLGPWIMPVDTVQMQAAKNLLDNTSLLRVQRGEQTVGMVVKRFETPFGDVDLLLDRWARADNFYAIDTKHAGLLTLYPFTFNPLAKTGDYEQGEVVGEITFCVRQDKAHAAWT